MLILQTKYIQIKSRLTAFVIIHRFRLEIFVQYMPEFLFQTVTIKSEKALHSVSVSFAGVFFGYSFELFVHSTIEIFSQEERPETEESVHFLRLSNTQSFAL